MDSQTDFNKLIRQYYSEMYLSMLKYAQCILSDTSTWIRGRSS